MQNNGPRRETPGTKGGVRDSHPPPQQPAASLKNLSHCFEHGRPAGQREGGALTWGARSTAEHSPSWKGSTQRVRQHPGLQGAFNPKAQRAAGAFT